MAALILFLFALNADVKANAANQSVHTIYVPLFKNQSLERGLEFELTKALIREINSLTPYEVVSEPDGADSELSGTITSFTKTMLDEPTETHDGKLVIEATVTWQNLKTGEGLLNPRSDIRVRSAPISAECGIQLEYSCPNPNGPDGDAVRSLVTQVLVMMDRPY